MFSTCCLPRCATTRLSGCHWLEPSRLLHSFVTSSYYDPDRRLPEFLRRHVPATFAPWERVLLRRYDPLIPSDRVRAIPSFDLALRLESRLAPTQPGFKRAVARWRTERFDRKLARAVAQTLPESVLLFSDVGSGATLPLCRRLGIPSIVSMVHGDVREEQQVLAAEAEAAPDFLPIYLGDAAIDSRELHWLHERRLQDLALADCVIVPSEHIADTLTRYGARRDRLRVIPYAADCRRFHPVVHNSDDSACTFLFAGGVTQRKGIKYLLEAWSRIRRPGWRLQLLGPLPAERSPLEPFLEMVEPLGRVSHAEMPALMARADVFVFPSLFEGSAVVTYERSHAASPVWSLLMPARWFAMVSKDSLFHPEGSKTWLPGWRSSETIESSAPAWVRPRARALTFDWPRYHASLVAVVEECIGRRSDRSSAHPGRKTG